METWFGSRYQEVWEIEGSKNRDSTAFMMSLNLLFGLSTRNGAIIHLQTNIYRGYHQANTKLIRMVLYLQKYNLLYRIRTKA